MQLDHDTQDAVEAAIDLVNTEDRSDGSDRLTTSEELFALLDAHRVSGARAGTQDELQAVRRLREHVRTVFEAAVAGDDDGLVTEINRLIADHGAQPRLVEHDDNPLHLHFSPSNAPVHRRLGADIGMALAVVVRDGGMDRLRVCQSHDCFSVLVDLSRNRSRRFCSIQCGNRQHVAAYRARQHPDT